MKKIHVGITKTKAFRAKAKAHVHLRGDVNLHYSLLGDYVNELKKCNPNTIVKIDVYGEENPDSPTRMFRRIYICLGALKDGVDVNNGIYIVAYGMVELESSYSWTWFLTCLCDDLDLFSNSKFTFIIDRQKGLLPAIAKLSAAEHGYCVRHIHENINMTWKGIKYKEMLWKCATALTVVDFNKHMDQLKGYNNKAYEWANCDLLINNICEVFNKQLLEASDSLIISALKYVREYLMKRIVILQKYTVDWNGADLCQVKGPYGDQCVVNLNKRVCSCRKWEVSGIPCKHVVACIHDISDNGIKFDCPTILLPPKQHPQIGRPPKKRNKSDGEIDMVKVEKNRQLNLQLHTRTQVGTQATSAAGTQAVTQVATQGASQSTSQAGGNVVGSQVDATLSPTRRTKKTASRLTTTKYYNYLMTVLLEAVEEEESI
ncbi:mutator type transposase [Tanacetum coccineum]